jgi:hypothetical protein
LRPKLTALLKATKLFLLHEVSKTHIVTVFISECERFTITLLPNARGTKF